MEPLTYGVVSIYTCARVCLCLLQLHCQATSCGFMFNQLSTQFKDGGIEDEAGNVMVDQMDQSHLSGSVAAMCSYTLLGGVRLATP